MQLGTITDLGLGSGMDLNSLIDKLIAVDKQPILIEQGRKTLLQTYYENFSTLGKKLSAFLQDVNGMMSDLNILQATSSNTDAATVSITGTPRSGVHSLDVTQIAQGQTWVSTNDYDSEDDTVATAPGTFSFEVGNTAYSINVDSSTTLSDFANEINNSGSGLQASIVYDGTGYKVVLKTPTGTANNLTITTNDTSLDFGTAPVVDSQDAELTLDGVSITSGTNTLEGYLPGVKIDLKGPGASTLYINMDTSKLEKDMENIVKDYNDVIDYINKNSSYDTEKNVGDAFFGSVAAESVENSLKSAFLNAFKNSGSVKYLSDLGITFTDSGKMEFDKTTFEQAVNNNLQDVKSFLEGSNGLLTNLQNSLLNATSPNGPISMKEQQLQNEMDNITKQIAEMNKQIEQERVMMTMMFAQMDRYIGVLKNQSNYMTQIFNSLNNSSKNK